MWREANLVLAAVLVTACGCGGGLKETLNDSVLADVPMDRKQDMLAARGEMDRVDEERNQVQLRVTRDDGDVNDARDGVKQARLEVDQARTEMSLQQRLANQDGMRTHQDRLRLAQLGLRTATIRLAWLQQKRDADRQGVDVVNTHWQWADARYELAKARLAQESGKYPGKNFSVASFEAQAAEMERRYDQARAVQQNLQHATAQRQQDHILALTQYSQLRQQLPGVNPSYTPNGYMMALTAQAPSMPLYAPAPPPPAPMPSPAQTSVLMPMAMPTPPPPPPGVAPPLPQTYPDQQVVAPAPQPSYAPGQSSPSSTTTTTTTTTPMQPPAYPQ